MKILSIDTSSKICGVSVLDNENLICNLDAVTENSHSVSLMPMISSALKKANLELKDIGLIVCDVGPGSFTGIRIGIATVKGFCDSLNIPCIGISSLEALAYPILYSEFNKNIIDNSANLVCSILDCKNENCYFALYQRNSELVDNNSQIFENINDNNILDKNDLTTLIEPQAESLEATLAILDSYCQDNFDTFTLTFVGDGSVNFKEKILVSFPDAKFADTSYNELNSYYLGLAGLLAYNNGCEAENILPLYLKKPLAQRQLEEKEKKDNK